MKIKNVIHGVKQIGVWNSIKALYGKYWFELRHGLKMNPSLDRERAQIENPHIEGHERYEPISHFSFNRMLKKIDWDFRESTFTDFGCGKGAAILLASQYGFKKYIGIEYSPELVKECITNIQKFSKNSGSVINYEIICNDATKYQIPTDANVFYFFNPFNNKLLDIVLQNIAESVKANKRNILLLYFNALHKDVVEKHGYTVIYSEKKDKTNVWYQGGNYAYSYNP